jgi:hypothetical protein
MSIVVEPVKELLQVLVDPRVMRDLPDPGVQLTARRQLAVEQEVRRLQERGALGELLDRVAPILENAPVAVDEGDPALARRGVHEGRVVGE